MPNTVTFFEKYPNPSKIPLKKRPLKCQLLVHTINDSESFLVPTIIKHENNLLASVNICTSDNISIFSHKDQEIRNTSNNTSTIVSSKKCKKCNKVYLTYYGFNKHILSNCLDKQKPFVCMLCEKEYVSSDAFKMHSQTHTLPFKCKNCGKAFSRLWLLKVHMRTHTGEKPYTCQHCQKSFGDRSNFRCHTKTHFQGKKYSCKYCSKTFVTIYIRLKHEIDGCFTNFKNKFLPLSVTSDFVNM